MSIFISLILWISVQPAHAEPRASGAGWSHALRQTIPDVIAVDLALRQADLEPRDASLVFGRTTWLADNSGLVHRHATVGWRQLAGPEVVQDLTARQTQSRRVCTMVEGHDPVPGGRTVHLYRQADPRDGELDADRRAPRFILGTGKNKEVLITSLRPGDQIQVTEAIPIGGGAPREHMELRRDGRTLTVTRLGNGSRICMADAS